MIRINRTGRMDVIIFIRKLNISLSLTQTENLLVLLRNRSRWLLMMGILSLKGVLEQQRRKISINEICKIKLIYLID